ncbi:MAG: hypothetical protein KA810_04660 [Pyrinomonadaceae bacterium]|nr:hypothetical protein [Pyrinomonadaceae bacterium]
MSEQLANVEFAHKLHEKGSHQNGSSFRLEIVEAFLLAIVAVATAWSGYQSAKWDGHSAESYAQAAAYRIDGDEDLTRGGQERLQNISTFNAWLLAKTSGNVPMMKLLERRFTPEYSKAFQEWLLTDPFNDPNAQPGPSFVPGYSTRLMQEGRELRLLADEAFEKGRSSREVGEEYVRLTVFLATVLFLIAISQRFKHPKAQIGLLSVAAIATGVVVLMLISYPRA